MVFFNAANRQGTKQNRNRDPRWETNQSNDKPSDPLIKYAKGRKYMQTPEKLCKIASFR